MACREVASAELRPERVDFARDVYPIFERHCLECHGPQRQEGELRLDGRQPAMAGGTGGQSIVPFKPDESELLRRASLPERHDDIMPARGKPLTGQQVETLRAWIAAGAVWPDKLERARHWAYLPPVRPELPPVADSEWCLNQIDHFVLARLENERLTHSPEADRAVLVRRLSLDFVGLPPSPAEVDAFLTDASDDAYERLVDRLLDSPQFGERWARPWLDTARYADSHGFQRDDLRQLWPYRDWVIRALNDDLPFDRFTIEQLAGDLLSDPSESQRVATGFHRSTTTNVEAGSDPEETRINQVIDRVNTTATVWLGTTLECAQCHDHKYDPFTQRDYYGLLAFFNNTEIEADRSNPQVPGSIRFLGPSFELRDEEIEAERERLKADLRQIDGSLAARRSELCAEMAAWEATLAVDADRAPATHVLQIAEFNSAEGAPHKLLEDGSVLLVDDPPHTDTYTIVAETAVRDITGIKLEALTDPSLPGMGPGRGDAERPNFVLNTFSVTASSTGDSRLPQAVRLAARSASFEQANYPLAAALDEQPRTGWAIAPRFHEPHWAVFDVLSMPAGEATTRLTFTLVQQFGAGRTLGRLRLSVLTGDPKATSLPADVAAILKTATDARSDEQRSRLVDFRLECDATANELRTRRESLQKSLAAVKPPTTLVMRELPSPRTTNIFTRGDFRSPGEPVAAGVPAVLHSLPDGPPNRLTLARWLVARDNPLTARVVVNRWWAELFGRGIVSTLEDFGIKGEPPTHPELLDWLAVEFMENGWSMKKLLRTIVTSATYRQSSRVTAELLARDAENLLYARGPRLRLAAEAIRDNSLAAAGLLALRIGGRPIRPYQPDGLWTKVGGEPLVYEVSPGDERYRRGVYVVWKRASPYPSFVNFDANARLACTIKRSRSNTPLQALTLLNDPVYVEAAVALARRVLRERPDAPLDEQLRYAWRLCLARGPDDGELAVLRRLFAEQIAAADKAAAKKLLDQFCGPLGESSDQLAAWYAVGQCPVESRRDDYQELMNSADPPFDGLTRRGFLGRSGLSLGTIALSSLFADDCAARVNDAPGRLTAPAGQLPPRAKHVIYLHMIGAPSQLDLFDHKPVLKARDGQTCPEELTRGRRFAFIGGELNLAGSPFKFSRHGESGQEISELLPHLATVADDIAIVRSLRTDEINHAPAQMFLHSGFGRGGRPSFGAWVVYGLGSENSDLPAYVVLQSGPLGGAGTSLWSAGFLPSVYQGIQLRSSGDPVLFLSNPAGHSPADRRRVLDAIRELNQRQLDAVGDPEIATRISQYEMAFRMQASVPEMVDLSRESAETLELYGATPGKPSFAKNCLLARRLVERGVRLVELYDADWDHHADLAKRLPAKCRDVDRGMAALVYDLKRRGLLDETLVIWGAEFGRTPLRQGVSGDGAKTSPGRDHHKDAFSIWLAGGGIKPGVTYGRTDDFGFNVVDQAVHVHDLNATVLHLLGLDHTRLTFKYQGREYRLTDVHGEVVRGLLA